MQQSILACSGLHKTYAGLEVAVLNGIDLQINPGEQVAIVGIDHAHQPRTYPESAQ